MTQEHVMSNISIEESMEAVVDAWGTFSGEIFNTSPISMPHVVLEDGVTNQLNGSMLRVDCNKEFDMDIYFLAEESDLFLISAQYLGLETPYQLKKNEMMDAIMEINNIISGGFKSRLNDKLSGGILIGLPEFIEKKVVKKKIR